MSLSIWHWAFILIAVIGMVTVRQIHFRNKKIKEAGMRRLELERQGKLDDLMKMNWREFEAYVCELFNQLGFEANLTKSTGDGGKDILIYKENFFAVAECKRYGPKTKVSRPDIQKFHSAMIGCKAEKGYYITTSEFTNHAISYVLDKPITLINGIKLINIVQDVALNKFDSDNPFGGLEE